MVNRWSRVHFKKHHQNSIDCQPFLSLRFFEQAIFLMIFGYDHEKGLVEWLYFGAWPKYFLDDHRFDGFFHFENWTIFWMIKSLIISDTNGWNFFDQAKIPQKVIKNLYLTTFITGQWWYGVLLDYFFGVSKGACSWCAVVGVTAHFCEQFCGEKNRSQSQYASSLSMHIIYNNNKFWGQKITK